MNLSEDDVIQILKLLKESNFEELHLEMGGLKLMVSKHDSKGIISESRADSSSPAAPLFDNRVSTSKMADAPRPIEAVPAKAVGREADEPDDFEKEGLVPVYSPMLGTFYRAPSPGASPFVEVGAVVTEEDTLCIIEVMKLYSAIKASLRGRITKVCAKDGQMVEYNQVLFLIEPETH